MRHAAVTRPAINATKEEKHAAKFTTLLAEECPDLGNYGNLLRVFVIYSMYYIYTGSLRVLRGLLINIRGFCDKTVADNLRKISWFGCPKQFRPEVWQILSGYLPPNKSVSRAIT